MAAEGGSQMSTIAVAASTFFSSLFAMGAYAYYQFKAKQAKFAGIPGPVPNGLKGNVDDLDLTDLGMSFIEMRKKYGEAFVIWLGPTPWVCTTNLDDLHAIWIKDLMIFDRGENHERVKPWLGFRSIVNIDNAEWTPHRKIFNEAMHQQNLDRAIPIIWDKGLVMFKLIKEAEGKKVDINDFLLRWSTDVTAKWAFDYETKALDTNAHSLVHEAIIYSHWHFLRRMWSVVPTFFWVWGLYNRAEVKKFNDGQKHIYELIYKIIDERAKTEPKPDASDLLSILVRSDKDKVFKRQDLAENLYTMFTATMNAPCVVEWCLALAHKHPDMQKKLRDELARVVGNSVSDASGIPQKQLDQLTYMRMFVDESMRLHPPVRMPTGRKCTVDYVLPGSKVKVPKGAETVFCPLAMHRDPALWGPDIDTFDPERFSEENKKTRHTFAFCPFEHGRRRCLGQPFAYTEILSLFAQILLNFEITDVDCSWVPENAVIARPTQLHVAFKPLRH